MCRNRATCGVEGLVWGGSLVGGGLMGNRKRGTGTLHRSAVLSGVTREPEVLAWVKSPIEACGGTEIGVCCHGRGGGVARVVYVGGVKSGGCPAWPENVKKAWPAGGHPRLCVLVAAWVCGTLAVLRCAGVGGSGGGK